MASFIAQFLAFHSFFSNSIPALSISAMLYYFEAKKPRKHFVLFINNKLLLPNQHNFANQNYGLMQKCCVFFTTSFLLICLLYTKRFQWSAKTSVFVSWRMADRKVQLRGKLERLQFSTSSSFVKILSACKSEFKAYFWTFWALYDLLFDLETIEVN